MRKRGVPATLFKSGDNEELRKKLKENYIACLPILELTLTRIVKENIVTSHSKTEREEVYQMPQALSYLADQQGYRRAMREVLKLLGETDAI